MLCITNVNAQLVSNLWFVLVSPKRSHGEPSLPTRGGSELKRGADGVKKFLVC